MSNQNTSPKETSDQTTNDEGLDDAACSRSFVELLDALGDWRDHYMKKAHPVALTLMRAKVTLTDQHNRIADLLVALERQNAASKLADDLAATLSDLWHHYSLTGAGYEVVESALSMWREHKETFSANAQADTRRQ